MTSKTLTHKPLFLSGRAQEILIRAQKSGNAFMKDRLQ